MSDIDHTRDCILPSDGKAEGLVKASELFALAAERDALRAENEKLRAALEAWNHAVRIDVLMEGPRYMGVSGEAGKRAWEMTRAALGGEDE